MRILIISQYYWPEPFRIHDLAVGLIERGHEVSIITGIPNYPSGRFYKGYRLRAFQTEIIDRVRVFRMPLVPKGGGSGFRMILYYLSLAATSSLIGPIVCRGKFDIIFVYQPSPITVGIPALVFKLLHKAPIFFWVQDIWPETLYATGMVKSNWILKIVDKMVRGIYLGCNRILVQSRSFIPKIQQMNTPSSKIRYFPNYAETLYKPVALSHDEPERRLIPNGFCIMFAGNLGRAQDFPTIISAARKLKSYEDIHWIILGDGTKKKWIEDQIQKHNLSRTVHLLGRYPIERMPRFFSLSDALLVTLRKEPIFSLTIPSKFQSYIACAKPVICAVDGEGKNLIKESGAGIAVAAGDPNGLAEAVLKLYNMDETERNHIGSLGKQYFEKHFERTRLLDMLDLWFKEEVGKCEY